MAPHLSSESRVQQGDPLGHLLFALVLHKVISAIDADDECLDLLYQAWYMDDGVLAGKRSAVLCALSLIKELGPSLGLLVNIGKYNSHLIQAVAHFNGLVPTSDATTETSLIASPPSQRSLSVKLDHFDFHLLFDQSLLADKAHLLSLDPLGHHAATCKRGGDAVLRHNKLRDILVESFHLADIHVQVEAGSGLSHDRSHSRPADILVFDWDLEYDSWGSSSCRLLRHGNIRPMTRSALNWNGLVYLLLWSLTVPGARKPRSVSHFLPRDWLSTRQAASPRRHLTCTAN
ncbi:hypothetical protein EMCRGX_G019472 [Ephydatia muelleri]